MFNRRHDDIVCFEVGSGDVPTWIGSRRTFRDDWATIETLAERGVIQLDVRGDQVTICGATRVGLIVFPSGRRLIIRSKIPSLMLLEWLVYVGEFPRLTRWIPEAGVTVDDDWHECIAKLFLHALEIVTRRHVRRDYVPTESDQTTIRGRILTTTLARRFHRLPHIPQIHRRRSLETVFNIVLALALDRLPVLLVNARDADRRRMARLREQWVSIRRDIDDPIAAVTAAQWASPPGYRDALQLARIILIGATIDPVSNMGGQVFTLPLSAVWERALSRMVDEITADTGWHRLPNDHCTRRWDDTAGRTDPKRWLTADAIAQRSGERWVLDAKYKREFGDESRIDRFQMCAYAVAFDAGRVSLVYPTASGAATSRELLQTSIGTKRLCVDSLDLPMAAGPETCRAALAKIAR